MDFTPQEYLTLHGALKAWGVESQKAMAVELLTMFGREAQGRDSPEDWATEIADVMVMCEQLALMLDYDLVTAYKCKKLEKLALKVERALAENTQP